MSRYHRPRKNPRREPGGEITDADHGTVNAADPHLDPAMPSCADATDASDKENDAHNLNHLMIAAAASTAAGSEYFQRVHFKLPHDIFLLKAVRAQQAHLKGVNGNMIEKWSDVQHDVQRAVRAEIGTRDWSASVRTLRERFNKLMRDYRTNSLHNVRCNNAMWPPSVLHYAMRFRLVSMAHAVRRCFRIVLVYVSSL